MKQKTSPTQRALNAWAIILIIWAVYRAKFQTTLPIWFDEFVAKPAVFIFPVYYYITRFEKKNFLNNIGLHKGITHIDVIISLFLTVVFIGTMYIVRGAVDLPFTPISTLTYIILISLATSLSEQILSTGFILHRLYDDSKNIFTAPFFSSVLFFFLHIPILFTDERIVGYLLLKVMVTDLLLSLSISFMYVARRNLLYPIIIHTFYNMSIYFLMTQ